MLQPSLGASTGTTVLPMAGSYIVSMDEIASLKRLKACDPTLGCHKLFDVRRNLKIGISLVYYVVRETGRAALRLIGQSPADRLTILYYHGVAADCRSNFVRQVNALRRRALVLPASYSGKLPAKKGKKCVAITFDDAFVSVAENALPELGKHSFHATIFVPVGWLGQTPGWAMKPIGGCSIEPPELSEVVMSKEQLRGLNPSLVSLGSHTLSHPALPELEPERAREEIERSRVLLGDLIGSEVRELAFPYGAHNQATVAMCRAAHYETVYSIVPEEVDTASRRLLRGRTKTEPSDGALEFFLKFNGAYEWLGYSIALKKALRSAFNAIRGTRRPMPKTC